MSPRLRAWVTQQLDKCGVSTGGRREKATCILDAFRKKVPYVHDPVMGEFMATPDQLLCLDEGGLCIIGGDCFPYGAKMLVAPREFGASPLTPVPGVPTFDQGALIAGNGLREGDWIWGLNGWTAWSGSGRRGRDRSTSSSSRTGRGSRFRPSTTCGRSTRGRLRRWHVSASRTRDLASGSRNRTSVRRASSRSTAASGKRSASTSRRRTGTSTCPSTTSRSVTATRPRSPSPPRACASASLPRSSGRATGSR